MVQLLLVGWHSSSTSSLLIAFISYTLPLIFASMAATAPRSPPFRAEHLGSLLRPKELLKTRNEWEAGKISQADLTPAEDEAVKKVVKVQLDNGFRAISDGEYRYASYCQLNMQNCPAKS